MKIKFNHPIVNGNNHLEEFNPNDISQYPEGVGIYCFGFRKKIDGKKVFIPLYVGISENLKVRLFQHYKEEKSNGNSKWYVFDYTSLNSKIDISDLYNDMMISDSKKGVNISRYSNKLIWFNNSSFFNFKLKVNCSKYKSNSGVRSSILTNGDLDEIQLHQPLSNASKMKKKIIESKAIFDEDFYFIYASLDEHVEINQDDELYDLFKTYQSSKVYKIGSKNGPGKTICEKLEHLTKNKLRNINIYTVAKSHGKLINGDIDLSNIQNQLVNLDNHNYNSGGVFINPLIL
jgi:hypothetical protein